MNKVKSLTVGRLICDTFTSSKELIKESDYSLAHLSKNHLDKSYKEIE